MVQPHSWRECRPAMIDISPGALRKDDEMSRVAEEVWRSLTIREKKLFHEYTCLNIHDREHVANMSLIGRRITLAAQARLN